VGSRRIFPGGGQIREFVDKCPQQGLGVEPGGGVGALFPDADDIL